MSLESSVYSAVTGDGTIGALIGTRLYPDVAPDDATFPAMVYQVLTQVPIGSNGCTQSRVQIDSYAASYTVVITMRDALIALANATGHWRYNAGPDFYEDDTELYRKVVEVLVAHEV